MEVRLNVDESLFNDIAESMGKPRSEVKATDITREALALFKWAAQKKREGYEVLAADDNGPNAVVVTPLLQDIRPNKK